MLQFLMTVPSKKHATPILRPLKKSKVQVILSQKIVRNAQVLAEHCFQEYEHFI